MSSGRLETKKSGTSTGARMMCVLSPIASQPRARALASLADLRAAHLPPGPRTSASRPRRPAFCAPNGWRSRSPTVLAVRTSRASPAPCAPPRRTPRRVSLTSPPPHLVPRRSPTPSAAGRSWRNILSGALRSRLDHLPANLRRRRRAARVRVLPRPERLHARADPLRVHHRRLRHRQSLPGEPRAEP